MPPDQYNQPYGQYAGAPAANFKRMQTTTTINMVFFGASVGVMLGGFFAFWFLLGRGRFVNMLEMVYVMIFGAILAVLDTPVANNVKMFQDAKIYIGKYVALIVRVTGKGLCFVFVGGMVIATLSVDTSGFVCGFGILGGIFALFVGIVAMAIGVMKSNKLNKAKLMLASPVLENRFPAHANTFRGTDGGLTPQEFNNLTMENGGFKWEDADLKLIFNALVADPTWRTAHQTHTQQGQRIDEPKVSLDDLKRWVYGGMVLL